MPTKIVDEAIREIEPLRSDETVRRAVERVLEAELPALPVVGPDGKFSGIFGEREFMGALFPGYVNTLGSAAMVRRSIDETIERREFCRNEPVGNHLTTDHVLVEDDYSDTQLAEIFLHHRVLVVPIATDGKVHAVITRADFFSALAERFITKTDED